MSFTNRSSCKPSELPCFTTAAEQKPILAGFLASHFADIIANDPGGPSPSDVNEHLWKGGNCQSNEWLDAELSRILGNK